MSPEQITADPKDIDIRSDVYALGVLTYEILTGVLPYDVENKSVLEAARIIREQPPRRISATRRGLRGDLDIILAKALEKNPGRRYQSAYDFAADIRHYLNREPISARKPRITYQLQKFIVRNKAAATAGILAIAAVLLGLGLTAWQAIRAERALADTRAIVALLSEVLTSVDPSDMGRDARVIDVLDRAEKRLNEGISGNPLIEAHLRRVVGRAYLSLAEYEPACSQLEQALQIHKSELGDQHPETLLSMEDTAEIYRRITRLAEAESQCRQIISVRNEHLGHDHPDTLRVMALLVQVLHTQTKYDEAATLAAETYALREEVLGIEHPDTLSSMNIIGVIHDIKGNYESAEKMHQQVWDLRCRVLGEDHPDSLGSANNMAILYLRQKRYAEAEPILLRTYEIRRRIYGPEHIFTTKMMINIGFMYTLQDRYEEAEPYLTKAVEFRQKNQGHKHADTLVAMNNLASLYRKQGRLDEACPLIMKVVAISRRVHKGPNAHLGRHLLELGTCLLDSKEFEEAEQNLLDAEAELASIFNENHELRLQALRLLIQLYDERGMHTEAEASRAQLAARVDPPTP